MILSIGVVAYNEQNYLPSLLQDICKQTYPRELMEVVLVDSLSTDNTRKIMEDFKTSAQGFFSVQVVSNPRKIQAAGWNEAIGHFKGEALARIDAHARLSPTYAANVVKSLETGESVAGGLRPCIAEKDTVWAKVLLQVENALFGSSINASRRSTTKTYVKTMFHAAYKREVFDTVGLFNETLLRTEDNEMHYRIRKHGYKLYYNPEILSYQYMRSSFKAMLVQKWKNGYWIGKTLSVCRGCLSFYHFVPAAFVSGIILTTLLLPWFWPLAAILWIIYGLFTLINTVVITAKDRFYTPCLLMPFLFLLLHLSYGLGTLAGLLSRKDGISSAVFFPPTSSSTIW